MKMAESSPKREENNVGKRESARYEQFSFSHKVFKRLIVHTRKNRARLGKG